MTAILYYELVGLGDFCWLRVIIKERTTGVCLLCKVLNKDVI